MQQISYKYLTIYKIFTFIFLMMVVIIFAMTMKKILPFILILFLSGFAIIHLFVLWYFLLGRYYNIKIDDKYFYVERFFSKNKIDIAHLLKVNTQWHFYCIAVKKTYSICLTFLLPNGKKSISFFAKPVEWWCNDIHKIEYYDKLITLSNRNIKYLTL